ncbi:MAG: hypothetical protein PVF58_07080 [Candidatus Methanofastidiosia archaeon]|jgi:hypothetical protein
MSKLKSLLNVKIKESFEFNPKKITGILNFRDAQFFFSGYITVDLKKILFHRAHLQNVAFIDCIWPDNYIIYEEEHMNGEDIGLTFNQLETVYRNLKQNMQDHGDYTKAGEFYYREMEMRRKGATIKNRLWLTVYRILAEYGEKPQIIIRNSFFVIFIAAILFFFCGVARVGAEILPDEPHT